MEQVTYYLFVLVALLLPLLLLTLKKRGGDGVRPPPGPWRLPVIGSLHHLLGKPLVHRAMADLARRLDAPLMYLKLGEVPVVVATSPDAAREIMKTHDVTFATRPCTATLKILMKDGHGLAFAPYGDLWRQLRKISVLELLSARRVREDEVARLVAAITATPPGQAVNVSKRIAMVIADSALRAMIGDRFKRRDEFLVLLEESIKLISGFSLGDLFPSSRLVNFVSGTARLAHDNHRKNFEFVESAIKQHEERKALAAEANGSVEEEDLLDVLLRIQKGDGVDASLSMGTIKALILDLFGAGSETAATTLQWAMAELMRCPNVMKRAQEELRNNLKGKPNVTEDDLAQMKYLKLVIKETLRLHVPGPLLMPRECRESCKILGYDVPKGTTVLVNAWSITRDPKYWKDPEEFKPERFEFSTIDFKGMDFEYIPFGAGRRMCPGMMFALANMELVLAALLYHFDWKLPDGLKPSELDMTEEMGITVRKKNDLHLLRIPCCLVSTSSMCALSTNSMITMDMPVLYSCLFLALLLLPLVILKARKANGHGGAVQRLPPGPWRLPVIGSLLHLLGNPHVHRAMADLARRHGDAPLMYLKLGEVPVVVASSPDAAREILVTRSASFASRPERRALRALISDDGAGLASAPYGAHWRQLRRTCMLELLSASRVRSLRRVREQEVARLLAAVAGAAGDDVAAAVNVSERADVMVAEATVRAMMGDGFERRGEYLDGIAEVRELFLGFDLGDLFPSSRLAGFVCGTARRAEAIRRKMFELMDCAIGQHQEQQIRSATDDDDEEDFLEVLLRLQREGGYEIPLTMAGVKDIILDLFLAGTETTTATIQWAMSELMRNHRVLHKVQAELRDKLQRRWTVTDDDLPGLHYLKLVIKETLRLHPAAPMLIRECGEEACKVLGYDVPKGARVLVNAWAINRDPRHWGADAETFRPEDGGGAVDFTGKDMELIPFGAGRRMCPGVAFAHATVELALAAMLYHFDWELPAGVAPREVDMEEAPGIVVGRKNDLYLHPVVRVPRAALAV
ncbi:hypothetical protein EJB05_54530, partial [Eragrostis curvula]